MIDHATTVKQNQKEKKKKNLKQLCVKRYNVEVTVRVNLCQEQQPFSSNRKVILSRNANKL